MNFSVCVAAYNEEKGITRLLNFLLSENLPEIVVYNDGSEDKTQVYLNSFQHYKNVRVINGEHIGYGPALNTLLAEAKHNIVVMLDADSLPQKGAIHKLVEPFKNPMVGATSGTHIIRGQRERSIVAYLNERIYKAKHNIDATQERYMHLNGLLFAIRKDMLPQNLAKLTNQDAYLGWIVTKQGYEAVFVHEAKSTFQPPRTFQDYLHSRKRVVRGHMTLAFQYGVKEYVWHECSLKEYLQNIFTAIPPYSLRGLLSLVFGAIVEVYYRVYWYYVLRKHPDKFGQYEWKQTRSTKW